MDQTTDIDSETIAFLHENSPTDSLGIKRKQSRVWLRRAATVITHALYLLIYTLCLVVGLQVFSTGASAKVNYLGTIVFNQETLSLRDVVFTTAEESIYAGRPSAQLDAAWDELLYGINIRVSSNELQRSNQTSVQLPDGQSSLAWLEATHQLHCVKFLRQWIYRDHYQPEVVADVESHWLLHADHCLELLRQSVMCHADTSLMTFEWTADDVKPMLKLEGPRHMCSNWGELMLKMRTRMITEKEMSDLKNPYLGVDVKD